MQASARVQVIGGQCLHLVPLTVDVDASGKTLLEGVTGLLERTKLSPVLPHEVFQISIKDRNDEKLIQSLLGQDIDPRTADLTIIFPIVDSELILMLWRKCACHPNPTIERLPPTHSPDFTHCYVAGTT